MFNKSHDGSFHNTNMALAIAMIANVMSWIILVFFLLGFLGTMNQLIGQWAFITFPTDFLELASFWVNTIFSNLILGLFAFAAVQGVSQLIYIALDVYYELVGDFDEVEDEDDETGAEADA
jgi:hypothetical protein